MKICVAQISPRRGDINANMGRHKAMIEIAAARNAGLIIFPELSLTGYEPSLAHSLSIDAHDKILDELQQLSIYHQIVIGAGVPMRQKTGVSISMPLFFPHTDRKIYSKNFLHADELPYFVSAPGIPVITVANLRIALAICYEISVDDHLSAAMKELPDVYIASVAKSEKGIDRAIERLGFIASEHKLPVMMSNYSGEADGAFCPGKSSSWRSDGTLLRQLDDGEGLLIYDTATATTSSLVVSGQKTEA